MEMKTRLIEVTTIRKAEMMTKRRGCHVQCMYGDAIFNDCVPAENRLQIIHQAYVTGLLWSVFVASKLVEREGSIVQTVVVEYTSDDIGNYEDKLLPRAEAIIGWLHKHQVIERGYLVSSDFPA